jgi:hypothetical protein
LQWDTIIELIYEMAEKIGSSDSSASPMKKKNSFDISQTLKSSIHYKDIQTLVENITTDVIDLIDKELHEKLALKLKPEHRGLIFQIALEIIWNKQYMGAQKLIEKNKKDMESMKDDQHRAFLNIVENDHKELSMKNAKILLNEAFTSYENIMQ